MVKYFSDILTWVSFILFLLMGLLESYVLTPHLVGVVSIEV